MKRILLVLGLIFAAGFPSAALAQSPNGRILAPGIDTDGRPFITARDFSFTLMNCWRESSDVTCELRVRNNSDTDHDLFVMGSGNCCNSGHGLTKETAAIDVEGGYHKVGAIQIANSNANSYEYGFRVISDINYKILLRFPNVGHHASVLRRLILGCGEHYDNDGFRKFELPIVFDNVAIADGPVDRSGGSATRSGGPARPGDTAARPMETSTAAAEAKTTPHPQARSKLTQDLDAVVQFDARGWVVNQYDVGSMHDATVKKSAKSNIMIAMGRYTYNHGTPGWIKVQFSGNHIVCIEYPDFNGQCRPVGRNPAGMMLGSAILATMAAGVGDDGGGGKTGGYQQHCDHYEMARCIPSAQAQAEGSSGQPND